MDFVRKKKRVIGAAFAGSLLLPCFFAMAIVFCFFSSGEAAEGGSVTMQTPSASGSGAVIGTDPQTGTRVMQTPEPKEQETYQGPQTVIVTPEVYPDRPGGNRPPHHRPPKPQPR